MFIFLLYTAVRISSSLERSLFLSKNLGAIQGRNQWTADAFHLFHCVQLCPVTPCLIGQPEVPGTFLPAFTIAGHRPRSCGRPRRNGGVLCRGIGHLHQECCRSLSIPAS